MITLTSLSTQLNDQLFGASFSAVPIASRNEGIRQALGQINAAFVTTYTISGLDGATATTMPDSRVSILLLGASAFILDFTIRSRLVTYPHSTELSEQLYLWSNNLKQDFDLALDRLRLIDLQHSTNPQSFQIPDNGNSYDPSLDA